METNESTDNNEAPQAEHVVAHEHSDNTGWAVVAYILFFIPLLTEAKDDPFVKFHVKQGFVLFLTGVVVMFISMVPPIMIIGWVLHIGVIVLAVIGIMNALNRKE